MSYTAISAAVNLSKGIFPLFSAFLAFMLANNLVMFIAAWLPSVITIESKKVHKAVKWPVCIIIFILTVAFLVSESYNPFLYFRF